MRIHDLHEKGGRLCGNLVLETNELIEFIKDMENKRKMCAEGVKINEIFEALPGEIRKIIITNTVA
jgi:hypothetical protein